MLRRRAVRAVCLAAALVGPACGLVHHHRDPPAPRPLDLNTASRRAIEKLPGITPSMARRIVEGRPFEDPHELVERRILTEHEFRRVADRVTAGRKRR
jgi:DNA uptake protein ComE-like DNA-binding protein